MTHLEEKIIDTIKSHNIHPKPKSFFLMRDVSAWIFLYAALACIGIATSISIFLFITTDWQTLSDLDMYPYEQIILSIPYVWIALGSILVVCAYLLLLHTKNGYRKLTWKFVSITLAVIIMIAIGLHISSLAEKIENVAATLPYYHTLTSSKKTLWSAPEKGLLAGDITASKSENSFTLTDLQGTKWNIQLSSIAYTEDVDLEVGTRVKIIGKIIATSTFDAIEVRPW